MPGTRIGGLQANESCGPFETSERAMPASALRKMIATTVRDNGIAGGVLDELEVVQANPIALGVNISTGAALLGDPADELYIYENPDAFFFDDFEDPHSSNDRIDLVGILLNLTDNSGGVISITGTPASNPSAPTHSYSDNEWLLLAEVEIEANASQIVNSDISDERDDQYIERTTFGKIRNALKPTSAWIFSNSAQTATINPTSDITNTTITSAHSGSNNSADQVVTNGERILQGVLSSTTKVHIAVYADTDSQRYFEYLELPRSMITTGTAGVLRQLIGSATLSVARSGENIYVHVPSGLIPLDIAAWWTP